MAILLVAMVVTYSLIMLKVTPKERNRENPAVTVIVQKVVYQQYHPIESLIVQAHSRQNTTVSALVSGQVKQVFFKVGDQVKKGENLIKIDQESYDIELEQQQANIGLLQIKIEVNKLTCKNNQILLEKTEAINKLAMANYDRNETLFQKKVGSKAALDTANERLLQSNVTLNNHTYNLASCLLKTKQLETEQAGAKARFRLAQKHLRETLIKAPYQGIITKKYVSQGRLVNVGQQIFSMYNPDEIELEGIIPNKYLSVVKQALGHGTEVKACLDQSHENQCYQLVRLSAYIPATQSGEIAYFKPLSKQAPIEGKTYYLYLRLPKIKAIAIPASAIYGGKMIYKITNNHLVMVPIQNLGVWFNQNGRYYRLIKSTALKSGEQVLVTYLPNAHQGLKVHYE